MALTVSPASMAACSAAMLSSVFPSVFICFAPSIASTKAVYISFISSFPSKALFPILITSAGMVTVLRLLFSNALAPISFMFNGMLTFSSTFSIKACMAMLVTLSGISTDVNLFCENAAVDITFKPSFSFICSSLLPKNAMFPIPSVNCLGSSTSVSSFCANAAIPIVVTLSGIFTDVSPLPLNTLFAMATTVSPDSLVEGNISSLSPFTFSSPNSEKPVIVVPSNTKCLRTQSFSQPSNVSCVLSANGFMFSRLSQIYVFISFTPFG